MDDKEIERQVADDVVDMIQSIKEWFLEEIEKEEDEDGIHNRDA